MKHINKLFLVYARWLTDQVRLVPGLWILDFQPLVKMTLHKRIELLTAVSFVHQHLLFHYWWRRTQLACSPLCTDYTPQHRAAFIHGRKSVNFFQAHHSPNHSCCRFHRLHVCFGFKTLWTTYFRQCGSTTRLCLSSLRLVFLEGRRCFMCESNGLKLCKHQLLNTCGRFAVETTKH